MSKLCLYYEEQLIGHLRESEQHTIEFSYDSNWLKSAEGFAISYSMPLRAETYITEANNFFSNLLPEGNVRTNVARKLGISVDNDFRLLEALGGECAGALTIAEAPTPLESRYLPLEASSLKDSYTSGDSILSFVQSEDEEIRLSLAGAQDKIPVLYKDGELFLTQGNSPSSHILKVPTKEFKHLPENECLMGMFAKNMSLEVASSQLIDVDGLRVFLIDRYDRAYRGSQLFRLHQEDFCQALSYSYKVKYQKDGGPTFKQCYETVESQSLNLPEDSERMIRWQIFNVLIGNYDAHSKNASLLMISKNAWTLSPHYDLVCTKAYSKLSKNLAMSIGDTYDSGTITGTHWRRLAQQIQVNEKWLISLVQEMAELSLEIFDETKKNFVERYGESSIIADLQKVIHEQQRRVLSELKK